MTAGPPMPAAPPPGPPAAVRVDRLRAEIIGRPAAVRDEPAGEPLYQAVRRIGALDPADPEELVRHLAGRPDRVLRAEAFRIAREALRAGLLPAAAARTLVEGLARDVPDALSELAAPWAVLDPLPHERMRRLLDAGPAAAIEVAARHGHGDLLAGLAADPGRPPALRRRCLELLGDLATREDVGELVAIAARDPLLLAGPAVACLTGLHRRGHFPAERDVPAVVGLALADHGVPAEDLAVVLYPRRHETLRELTSGGGDTRRRLDLLAALDEQGAPDLGIGDAVTALARRAGDPAPFLRAIRRLRHAAAEETVLELLPRSPREALAALEAVGGARTVAVLRDGLGLDGGGVAPHLGPFRHRALEILWHLGGDPALRRAIMERLDPRDLPRRIAADLGGPDARELALLRANPDPRDPAAALRGLAANGDATTLPAIADLLLRVVSEAAAEGEAPVPDDVLAAVGELGGRLFRRGALRPCCLLDAADAAEAGNALIADLALGLLERPGLGPAERAGLLDVVGRAPHHRTRARVHRLLRDRDRHVRARAVAILAGDGGDARALSASLVPLTAAGDVQTVRQAIVALAEAGADWAAPAIADCLDHPTMNVKKAAASALARAGAPGAVPKLLSWLGRHDNPGLREAIAGALRAILGDAFAATVLAAADRAADPGPLLRTLDGLLDERAVAALARRGVVVRGRAPSRAPAVEALLDGGWDAEIARGVVAAHEREPGTLPYGRLRPLLVRWLDLAATDPGAVRLVAEICRPPWPDAELEVLARSAGTLVDGLAATGDHDRLLALLTGAIPRLARGERRAVAERARGLGLGRAGLVVLRLCAVPPARGDVERALAAARRGEDPGPEQEAVLREAFGQDAIDDRSPFREELGDAVRDAVSLRQARDRARAPSRVVLDALIRVSPQAPPDTRDALLDWMLEVQPLGVPPWTIAEEARRPVPDVRVPHPADLDQPRSGAQRRRLLAMLDDAQGERRATAARILLGWPEPQARLAVLRAFLHGRPGIPATPDLARTLADAAEADLAGDGAVQERVARLAVHLDPGSLDDLVPRLLHTWEHGGAAASEAAGRALRRASPDVVAAAVSGRLAAGARGLLDLVAGRPVLRTPDLVRTLRRLRDEGRDDLAAKLVLVEGPLRAPGAAGRDEEALDALRERPAGTAREPSRAELFAQARDGGAKAVKRALTLLAERHEEAGAAADPELADLLAALIAHPETKVRLHAHRVSRRVLDRRGYLDQTIRLLDDPEPAVVRSAARTLGHAAWEPAVPGLVALLSHSREPVRAAAADALVLLGAAAVPALRHAEGRARPDRRNRYTSLLERIAATGSGATGTGSRGRP